ncbi:hypothetical protein C0J52_25617, partial [Blattella germanica]
VKGSYLEPQLSRTHQTNTLEVTKLLGEDCHPREHCRVNNSETAKSVEAVYNITMIDVNLERNGFTRHGLHMNNRGKEILSREIAEKLSGRWTTATIKPIIMKWKDKIVSSKEVDVSENLEITENNLACEKTTLNVPEQDGLALKADEQTTRTSTRTRRLPLKLMNPSKAVPDAYTYQKPTKTKKKKKKKKKKRRRKRRRKEEEKEEEEEEEKEEEKE